ncbi:MAG: outer membrane lipoprotein chaperone LolA [Gammaproteobacteria bacterium]|nr:outer membrane lipoprotein chaperone LolA [Gammaproteobacteria bacterium]
MKEIRTVATAMLLVFCLSVSAEKTAGASAYLEHFFSQVNTFSGSFDQVVMDEGMNAIQESSGYLWIKRPGKFRWEYELPYAQQIIGDGSQLWIYDVELRQVTHKKMSGALGQTPAMLLAGKGQIQDRFIVKALENKDKLEWLQLQPKTADGGYETIRVGFDHGALRVLEMVDGFGQTTRVTLRRTKENKKISDDKFNFKPPKGVDVIGQ